MAKSKKNNQTAKKPQKKLWVRIALLLICFVMVMGIVLVPFLN